MLVLLAIGVILLCLAVAADHPSEPAIAAAWIVLALASAACMWREIVGGRSREEEED